ncbi:alginate lyase-domain-containing protein [Bisporella sp. PMI_857]|nr:alginate lyase-domain-containing protein [Bisporella sp. PMI_857]
MKSTLFHLLLLAPLALAVPAKSGSGGTSSKADDGDASTTDVSSKKSTKDSTGDSDSGKTSNKASSGSTSKGDAGPISGFQFEKWSLQLPIGSPGKPQTIPGSKLATYQDPKKEYYFMEGNVVVMKVPPASSGCVHTPNSKHCRTEFRESNPRSWSPKKPKNRLYATLQAVKASDTKGVCVGQIHIDDKLSVKPVAELYYNSAGQLTFGVGQTKEGGNQIRHNLVKIPVGTKFTYMIAYENDVLYVEINGKRYPETGGFPNKLGALDSYFKAGNYVQGEAESEIHFFGIRVEH